MPLNDEARGRFDKIDGTLAELFRLQRDTHQRLNDHVVSSGIRDAEMGGAIKSAHDKIEDHIDDHKEKRAWWIALWGAVITALAGAVFASVKLVMKG